MEQKALVLDIETSPLTALIWQLKDQYVDISQILEDWHLMAWGAKWLGDPPSKMMYMDQRKEKDIKNDKKMLSVLWKLLDEADIVITQNGEKFDSPKLNARFITWGMHPPKPYRHLDTYKIVKKAACFTSNKLEYLTNKLCTKYKKLSHGKFPGLSLWKECKAGNLEAWEEMKKYNINDVLSTEELYMKIRAWNETKNAPSVFIDALTCAVCGSTHIVKQGFDRTSTASWQRLKCQDCGKWCRGEKVKP